MVSMSDGQVMLLVRGVAVSAEDEREDEANIINREPSGPPPHLPFVHLDLLHTYRVVVVVIVVVVVVVTVNICCARISCVMGTHASYD